MDLIEAKKELEKLNNEYDYWLKEKENLMTLVMPKAMSVSGERVDGGKRTDKMLEYIELLDEKKINETLDYIFRRQTNLMNYIDNELKRIGEYTGLQKRIYKLRLDEEYIKEHNKKRPWWQVANMVGYSERQCRRIFKRIENKRDI